MSLLVTDVTVGDRPGRAVHVVDGRIAWVGDAAEASGAERVIAGEGALLTPAFVDAHVHATATGLALTGLDLHSSSSLAETVALIGRFAQRSPGTMIGTGWDETGWPERRGLTRADLDAVLGYRPAYLARVDVHSATVSTALLDSIPGVADLPGFSPDGRLRLDAHHAARQAAYGAVDTDQRRAAQRATLDAAAALGIGSLHEMAGPEVSGVDDLAGLLALAAEQPGPEVVGYWGELAERGGLDVVRELGLAGAGGDLFCDGALGSHTAALGGGPYADRPDTAGTLRFATGQLVHHIRTCTAAGIQAGFHVIGNAAVAQAIYAVEAVAAELGRPAVRACRHRLEHVELIDRVDLERMRDLGMVASVQPAFDAAWGGDAGMYAERLGVERALAANPFAAFSDAGVVLAIGSDAPVTPLDPWGGVHAAVDHRTQRSGLRPFDAFDAATHGGWYAARAEHPIGPLAVGAPAHLALWATNETLSAVLSDRARPVCRHLLVDGEPIGAIA
ncbi:amidohydrolase family protein [Blastococcus sp. CT_GayMR16]|uniref:amidohydrolase n=1 Tax=Blastococcus sp. CT_GayMR16 TaxID=2559607 RepID=UPI0010734701|nr:amidohydrolase family protein [Blastococcus sp. CT_GayMR16]TFV85856.1 amidohydrolase [Blastococcus sp. CT_GayMR16]